MIWETPVLLFALWIVPLTGAVLVYSHRKRAATARRFADAEMVERLMPSFRTSRFWIKSILLMVALCCLIAAAARPRFGVFFDDLFTEFLPFRFGESGFLSPCGPAYPFGHLDFASQVSTPFPLYLSSCFSKVDVVLASETSFCISFAFLGGDSCWGLLCPQVQGTAAHPLYR